MIVVADIDECQDPAIASRCVENAECCNLPAHFLCKCKDGYTGDGEVLCTDIDECSNPLACGAHAQCINTPGNHTCACPEGFVGNPYDGCQDVDECAYPNVCGPGAICTNLEGSYRCNCPPGYDGDGRAEQGCVDLDECARTPCGRNADCLNTDGSFRCLCPDGFSGDPMHGCEGEYNIYAEKFIIIFDILPSCFENFCTIVLAEYAHMHYTTHIHTCNINAPQFDSLILLMPNTNKRQQMSMNAPLTIHAVWVLNA